MEELSHKLKRVQPLIKVRKLQLDKESHELAQLRRRKQDCLNELQRYQNQYMQGIDSLNKVRQSTQRKTLEALERSLDVSKARWYKQLKELRKIENQEKAQIAQVVNAERNLKSVESLQERYKQHQLEEVKRQEQKIADEASLRKFTNG